MSWLFQKLFYLCDVNVQNDRYTDRTNSDKKTFPFCNKRDVTGNSGSYVSRRVRLDYKSINYLTGQPLIYKIAFNLGLVVQTFSEI